MDKTSRTRDHCSILQQRLTENLTKAMSNCVCGVKKKKNLLQLDLKRHQDNPLLCLWQENKVS